MFQFRLTPLLKIRENIRRERLAELTKSLEAEAVILEKLEGINNQIVETKKEARERIRQGKINVDYMIGLRRHEAFLLAQQSYIQEKLEILRQEIEKRRQAVIEADKEVRVMEKLREKQKERYDESERAKETVLMDEIAGQKSLREVKL